MSTVWICPSSVVFIRIRENFENVVILISSEFEVYVHLKSNIVSHGSMKNLVELLLCLPGSNAFIGGMFSRTNQKRSLDFIWTKYKPF